MKSCRPNSLRFSAALPIFLVAADLGWCAAPAERNFPLPGGVPMHFAWIAPGTFWRGSAETELGRDRDEGPRHAWFYSRAVTTQRRPDGTVPYGYRAMPDERTAPWHVAVPDHPAVAAGEHPRLLFRRSELPALRHKARSPEGQAILKRLRQLLDGDDGEHMTTRFNPAGKAYSDQKSEPPIGTYTIGHAAGYGLLYQLSGDSKYAEFGRQYFEKALAGTRDRDGRYSFRQPGGALRAGPTLGWMAVGYDLCYDGWDAATRERFGRALFAYREQMDGARPEKSVIDLEHLTSGTMPPYSNHFGMQVGGAALVLLALSREPWADQPRIDALLHDAEQSLVRNLAEGFGDGGFFAEGDGTGSMSSQIVFLSALQAWGNVTGQDFFNAPRPNARMLTLKWIYQTVFRDGRPDFWPVRGGYPHNVWSREGQSGAGYFAVGLGSVTDDQRAAMKWCYDRFLAPTDAARGAPFDTASVYPHFAVSAFVNWPVDLPEKNPAQVLPHVYRDSVSGFYCWRDRWQDENDTVITVLTNETRGYMGAKADSALMVNSRGRHFTWGTITGGSPRHWSASPRGETSALTLADGTAFGVDFSRASGADLMLVTTGRAEGQAVRVADTTLTFFFPTTDPPPRVAVESGAAVVGRQRVTPAVDQLVFTMAGR